LDRAEAGLVEVSGMEGEPDAACCVEIRAPVDGVVLEIDMVSERPVSAGTRLLTVGDPAALEIVADLLSADAVPLAPGTRASVERWGGPPLEARLLRVEPTARTQVSALGIEEQRVDAIFEFTSPTSARAGLGHGFAVFLRVVSFEVADTLMVPLSATFRLGDQWSVFRLTDDERVERVAVSLGPRNARQVAVEAGLSEGDRVVVHPNETLTDGAAVVERTAF
jgi:HlyD family secretion protein